MELLFLEHTYRWLVPGGVFLFVVPEKRLSVCIPLLASNFSGFRLFRLTDPESIRFGQVVLTAVRKSMRGDAMEANRTLLQRLVFNGRHLNLEFNTASFPEEILGIQGNAKRRIFYGPGIDNYDASLQKSIRIHDSKSFDLRFEGFNVFNHAQFFGPAAVDGQVEDPAFRKIVSASSPRLVQLAAKFHFRSGRLPGTSNS